MTKLRLYPHRTASEQSVRWHHWWIEQDGQRSPLPPFLSGWDYLSDVTIGITVEINATALLESSGQADVEDLEVLARADCAAVQQRFVSIIPLSRVSVDSPIDVRLRLPPGEVAGAMKLSGHLILAKALHENDARIAYIRGARIHSSDPSTLVLEGDASRFPTEPVRFSEIGFGNAPWTVLTIFDSPDEAFMGGVRLLVNVDHPVGRLALHPQTSGRVSGMMRAEILRTLVAKLSPMIPPSADTDVGEEGSVRQVVETMTQVFLGRSLRTTCLLQEDDPAEFERLLHDRLNPTSGLLG